MTGKINIKSPKETAIDLLNMMFGTNFKDLPLEELNPVEYQKTPEEIARKYLLLQALYLLADPHITTDQILMEIMKRISLQKIGDDAEYFLRKRLKQEKLNAGELEYINTICCDQTLVLAQALCLEPCLFDRDVLCRSREESWKSIRKYSEAIPENQWCFSLCPVHEMATEYDFVTCLLCLYQQKEPHIHNFLSKHNLYKRLCNYCIMLNWLFSDCPFDMEVK